MLGSESASRHRFRWVITLLTLGIGLQMLAGCARPASYGLADQSKSLQATAVTTPGPDVGIGSGPVGRSGPPPLGLVALSAVTAASSLPRSATEPAQGQDRATPSAPPRKPDRIIAASEASDREANQVDPVDEDSPAAGDDSSPRIATGNAVPGLPAIGEPTVGSPGSGASLPGSGAVGRAPNTLEGPDRLMGLTSTALTRLLGSPSMVRHEAPAQIWQYRQSSCVFDIFLYEESGEFRVAYFEARDHKAQKQAPEPCFSGILDRPELSFSG